MTLDESIKVISGVICEWFANGPVGIPNPFHLETALHGFAAAISAKASEVQREKPCCQYEEISMCTEAGKVFALCDRHWKLMLKQPTPELPQAVRERIDELYHFNCKRWEGRFRTDMEEFAHLCLSMRAK